MFTISLLLLTEPLGISLALEGFWGGSVLSVLFLPVSELCSVRFRSPSCRAWPRFAAAPPHSGPTFVSASHWADGHPSAVAHFIPRSVPSFGALGLCPPLLKGKKALEGEPYVQERLTEAHVAQTPWVPSLLVQRVATPHSSGQKGTQGVKTQTCQRVLCTADERRALLSKYPRQTTAPGQCVLC